MPGKGIAKKSQVAPAEGRPKHLVPIQEGTALQSFSESPSGVARDRRKPQSIVTSTDASTSAVSGSDLTPVAPGSGTPEKRSKKKKFGRKGKHLQKRDTLDEHETQLKRIFQEFDADGSGGLDRVELQGVFAALGYTQEEAVKFSEEFMIVADKDQSDSVNFDELREFIATVRLLKGQGKSAGAKEVMAEAQRDFLDAEEEEESALKKKFKGETPHSNRRGRRRSSTAMSSESGRRGSWMNDFVQKLFGTGEDAREKKVIERARKRRIERPCIIDPQSSSRTVWDLIMIVLILWTSVILPFRLSFLEDEPANNNTSSTTLLAIEFNFWFFADLLQDTLFMVDIILNFRTAYFHDGILIVSINKIAKRYLKGWFFIDFLSTVPFDYLFLSVDIEAEDDLVQILSLPTFLRLFRLVRLVKLLRLMRFARLMRYFRRWEDRMRIRSGVLRIVKLIFMVLMFAHWNACIQFLAAALAGFLPNAWPVEQNLVDEDPAVQWSWAMFNVLSHMLSIGYGREAPYYVYEVWLTAFSMLMGATFYAVFIGNISILLLSFDTSGSLFNEKMQLAEEYMNFRNLPSGLRRRLRQYYTYKWNGKKAFDEQAILDGLSQSLRTDINIFICRDLIYSVPFFHSSDPGFVRSVVSLLRPTFYLPADLIIREGELAYDMFFIRDGDVEVFTGRGDVCTDLSKGSYFGEIALLMDCKRTASIRALTHSEIFALHKLDFKNLMLEYPDIQDAMTRIARIRLDKLEEHKGQRTGYRVPKNETHRFLGTALGVSDDDEKKDVVDEQDGSIRKEEEPRRPNPTPVREPAARRSGAEDDMDGEEGISIRPEELNGRKLKGDALNSSTPRQWASSRRHGSAGMSVKNGSSPDSTKATEKNDSSPTLGTEAQARAKDSAATASPKKYSKMNGSAPSVTIVSPQTGKQADAGRSEVKGEQRESGGHQATTPQNGDSNAVDSPRNGFRSATTFLPILQDALSSTLDGTPPPPSTMRGRRHRRTIQMPSVIEEELLRVTAETGEHLLDYPS